MNPMALLQRVVTKGVPHRTWRDEVIGETDNWRIEYDNLGHWFLVGDYIDRRIDERGLPALVYVNLAHGDEESDYEPYKQMSILVMNRIPAEECEFIKCEHCGSYWLDEDIYKARKGSKTRKVCTLCLEKYYDLCLKCGEFFFSLDKYTYTEHKCSVCDK